MKKFFPFLVFLFVGSFFGEAVMAECRIWVDGYYRKNGTYVKGHYRTCPDGDKNNNYGSPDYKGQPARERDQDKDGIPNYRDRDDNNNGLTDNTDHAIGKILREADPRKVRIPRHQNTSRYEDFPIIRGAQDRIIIYIPRSRARTTTFEWDYFGNCIERSRQGYEIGRVDRNLCREEVGSTMKWDIFGRCYEETPNGTRIQELHRDYCRAYVGRYFEWTIFGKCEERTPDGYSIGEADRNACRLTVGSRYEFDYFGNCIEQTPNGYQIRKVEDKNYCRYENYGSLNNPAILQSGIGVKNAGSALRQIELNVEGSLIHSAQ